MAKLGMSHEGDDTDFIFNFEGILQNLTETKACEDISIRK